MSKPITQALSVLIPRHSGTLPPELVELASSLLAQSRNKCSNLKPDEEIGRAYACAHIACERLKTSLNLPPIEPRPPVPPKAYRNLYAYFDRALTTSSARARARAKNSPQKATTTRSVSTTSKQPQPQAIPQRLTPSKETSPQGFRKNRSSKPGLKYTSNAEKSSRIPKWVSPIIRLLCRSMDTQRAIPHLLAGVESVLCMPCPSGEEEKRMEGKIPALIAALWFFVVVRMRGKEGQGKENLNRKKMVRDVLNGAQEDEDMQRRVGVGGWEGWEEIVEKDVASWRMEIVKKGWREIDWFLNIEEGCGVDGEDQEYIDEEEDTVVEEIGKARPGSMLQEKYNYLSSANMKVFSEWKKDILAKIDALVSEGVMDAEMEITKD